jgi:hypothetical protein
MSEATDILMERLTYRQYKFRPEKPNAEAKF